MYLIFHLHRPDVLVPEDLGVRAAAAAAYSVPPDRAHRLVQEKERAWSPYASVAARVLWAALPALRGR